MSRSRTDGGWIYPIDIDKGDSMLHNPVVARELSWIMLHHRDIELDSQTISEMVSRTFPTVIKESLISFLFLFQILAKDSLG